MAEEHAGVDSVRPYLTGATYTGEWRASHSGSLGAYRSGVKAKSMFLHRFDALRGIVIEYVSALNGIGVGSLVADSTSSLRWTPPSGTQGTAVTIANGETKVLYGGDTDADKYIIVRRTSATGLSGSEIVQTLDGINNVLGGTNFTGDEAAAGEEKYRALMFLNGGDTQVTDLKVWVDGNYDVNVRIAKEDPDGNGALTDKTGDGEESQPGGLDWSTPTTEGGALTLAATLAADGQVGLWIERSVDPGATAEPIVTTVLHYKFTLSGTTHYGQLRGLSRVAENGLKAYLLFYGQDGMPDITGTADEEFDSVPHATAALTAGHDYYMITCPQNEYGLRALVREATIVRLADDLSEDPAPPSGPNITEITPAADGEAHVVAAYFPAQDAKADRATKWLVYLSTDGTEPDPGEDEPAVVDMEGGTGIEQLDWDSSGAYLEGTPEKVLVRTRRIDGETNIDSTNTTVYETEAEWFGPARPVGTLSIGKKWGQYQAPEAAPDDEVTYIDEAKNVRWVMSADRTELWADTVLIWNLGANSDGVWGLHTVFTRWYKAVSGAGTGAVEVGTWDGGEKILYFNVDSTHRIEVDVVAQEIRVILFRPGLTLETTISEDPIWRKYHATCFQYWDQEAMDYVTGMAVDNNGALALKSTIPWRVHATQAECL